MQSLTINTRGQQGGSLWGKRQHLEKGKGASADACVWSPTALLSCCIGRLFNNTGRARQARSVLHLLLKSFLTPSRFCTFINTPTNYQVLSTSGFVIQSSMDMATQMLLPRVNGITTESIFRYGIRGFYRQYTYTGIALVAYSQAVRP